MEEQKRLVSIYVTLQVKLALRACYFWSTALECSFNLKYSVLQFLMGGENSFNNMH